MPNIFDTIKQKNYDKYVKISIPLEEDLLLEVYSETADSPLVLTSLNEKSLKTFKQRHRAKYNLNENQWQAAHGVYTVVRQLILKKGDEVLAINRKPSAEDDVIPEEDLITEEYILNYWSTDATSRILIAIAKGLNSTLEESSSVVSIIDEIKN